MLPSKGRRKIVVNGTVYHYTIKCDRVYIRIIIRNSETGKILNWEHPELESEWVSNITPKFVEDIINQKGIK